MNVLVLVVCTAGAVTAVHQGIASGAACLGFAAGIYFALTLWRGPG